MNHPPPPPLARLAAILLLALSAGPAVAQQCDASHIALSQAFPLGGAPATEGLTSGIIARFQLEGCDNPGSPGTPREYRIPFCAEFFDTTPCDAAATDCLSNNVAGASGLLRGVIWKAAGGFKGCANIAETASFASAVLTAHDNTIQDKGENSLYVIMRNPTRTLRIPIRDND